MNTIETFLQEINREAETTRKILSRVPGDKYDWQPHPKSMTLRRLAAHVAELPGWVAMAIDTDELDLGNNPYPPDVINNNDELMASFERALAGGRAALAATTGDELDKKWILRNGSDIYQENTKAGIIRVSISQTIHHRAQLGVYLRLLNVPIPGSYGPSADEMEFALQEA